jgi:hypothetical protein
MHFGNDVADMFLRFGHHFPRLLPDLIGAPNRGSNSFQNAHFPGNRAAKVIRIMPPRRQDRVHVPDSLNPDLLQRISGGSTFVLMAQAAEPMIRSTMDFAASNITGAVMTFWMPSMLIDP